MVIGCYELGSNDSDRGGVVPMRHGNCNQCCLAFAIVPSMEWLFTVIIRYIF